MGGATNQFQSLFLWNSRPDPGEAGRSEGGRYVSILVFVELAPGRHKLDFWPDPWQGFNPCFCGTRARTFQDDLYALSQTLFQSLFLWNSRPDLSLYAVGGEKFVVSILVFVELAPGQ